MCICRGERDSSDICVGRVEVPAVKNDVKSNNGGHYTSQPENSSHTVSPADMWATFFQSMAENLQNKGTNSPAPRNSEPAPRKMKPSDVYISSFDPDDCEFTAAQWCDEIDHHRTQNSWTDYETRNVAFTHLRGRARRWASKSYPLCKTWDETKERLSRQFASTKRFHDIFLDVVRYNSDSASSYIEYSTNKLALIDRLETSWSEPNKVEVVISVLTNCFTIAENHERRSWKAVLGEVQLALNCTISKATGKSPLQLLMGCNKNPPRIGALVHEYENLDLFQVRREAKARMDERALIEKARYDQGKAKVQPFSLGDIVLVEKNPRVITKLSEKFSNPCRVVEVCDNDRYKVEPISGGRIQYVCHEKLRKFPQSLPDLSSQLDVSETAD
ncbi:hypothetical protein ABMA28_011230 [Loxostege sticticalis]|uniref:Retrotransposon gag domain-containing protein n=1 Tax=Loxostege sticticalis TaxID=481309 RepID=A0ABD0S8U8_LOXSC